MGARVAVKIEGLEEIRKRMSSLVDHIQRRMLVDVMKKSLKKAMDEAKARAPVGYSGDSTYRRTRIDKKSGGGYSRTPGMLKNSFRLKKMRSSNPFLLEVQLQNTAYYALWVEYGHKIVRGRKGNKRTVGSAAPVPFMRPTFESNKSQIEISIAAEIKAALSRRGV